MMTTPIDWHNIETVLLDMDGTLLDLHFDNHFWLQHLPLRYAQHHGVSEAEASAHIHTNIQQLEGTLQWYCLDHWSELMGMDIPTLKRETRHKIQIRPHTERFLQQLQAWQKQVVLITNSHRKGLELKLDVTGIGQWLDTIISSHDYASPKEHDSFWQHLHTAIPFDMERTVFIDDTPRVLDSAHKFGLKHLICITAPDSQKTAHPGSDYINIAHFDEIMPPARQEASSPTYERPTNG